MNPRSLSRLILACLATAAGHVRPALAPQQGAEKAATAFLCPPCGGECHFTTYEKPGSCGGCGMTLVPLASVPQVGVLLTPDTEPASLALPLLAFASSDAVRVFTVADSKHPVRARDVIE